jgi:hypothetical protein
MSIISRRLALLLAGAGVLAAPGLPAEARSRGDTNWSSVSIETQGPTRGYSGFLRIGPRNYYCDYQRIPNRQCTIDGRGNERCRIVSWTLKQSCS